MFQLSFWSWCRLPREARATSPLRKHSVETISFRLTLLPEPVFQFDPSVGLFVAVLHDHGSVEGKIPLPRPSLLFDRARARHDHGIFGNLERRIGSRAVDLTLHEIVDRR